MKPAGREILEYRYQDPNQVALPESMMVPY